MIGPGHNRGPLSDPGLAWRAHCWSHARRALLPHLPVEVLRGRLRRAGELGLDYSTYAGIRATTGHDVIAVLFSSNALQAPSIPKARSDRAHAVKALRLGLASAPLRPCDLADVVDEAHPAPAHLARFAAQRAAVRVALRRVPADQALLIGAFALEREWCAAAGLGAYLDAARYFAPRP